MTLQPTGDHAFDIAVTDLEKALERITALEAELKQSREYITGMREQMVSDLDDLKREWRDRAKSAEAECDGLRRLLGKYGCHILVGPQ